ncbi:helix-turn-helix domain-containing protein [Thalassovita sp.]|jgi:transcriptional regulator with XRE-family HTH domain|uniref:helix-turn-helix domain-containing protein n=1 Tax=Thalassovita sp. TaxID=1979401 RepID=UPI003B5C47E1
MAHPIDVHVGMRIRQRRWMMGMTQQQLAESVGTKFQQIQKYETGANRVSASRLWRISQALEVSVEYLFEELNTETAAQGGSDSTETEKFNKREAQELLRAYYSIPAPQRRHLLDLARAMSNAA